MTEKLVTFMPQRRYRVGALLENAASILADYKAAVAGGANLMLTAEGAVTGYGNFDQLNDPTFRDQAMITNERIAKYTGETTLVFGSIWQENGHIYNAAIVARNGEIVSVAKKCELPTYGVFHDARHFEACAEPRPEHVVTVAGVKCGIAICEDVWFPRVPKALKALGAEVLLVLNASPFDLYKMETRRQTLQERFAETKLPILYNNVYLGQDGLIYDGRSKVVDHEGDQIILGTFCGEDDIWVTRAEDGTVTATQTGGWQPKENANNLGDVYTATVFGTREYVEQNGFEKVIVSVSGGVDSALVLAIAVDAVGAENVLCLLQPYKLGKISSQGSVDDSWKLIDRQGIPRENCYLVHIDAEVEAARGTLNAFFGVHGLTLQNLQSRLRGVNNMAYSNAKGALLLTTGNKSEIAVGYATLYGDTNGGYNPLKDMPKTMVFAVCDHVNMEAANDNNRGLVESPIPQSILTKPPSAELEEGQEDSQSLPEYDILDAILCELVDKQVGLAALLATGKYDPDVVKRVYWLLRRNEFKRSQAAVGTKLTPFSFNEWMYPITNGWDTPAENDDSFRDALEAKVGTKTAA